MNRPDKTREIVIWFITIGVCMTLAKCAFSQCVTDIVPFPYGVYNECYQDSLNVTNFYSVDCPSFYLGGSFVYEFYSNGVDPISIVVDSELEYTFCEDCEVFAHGFITDGCIGETVWSSSNSCIPSPMVDVIQDTSPSQNWNLDILLPEGLFYFHIGNVGLSQVQNDVIGCYDLIIGTSDLLSLGILEHKGLNIKENYYLYNILGQKINR